MPEMVLLQPEPQPPLHGEMVRRIMEHVIANVTEDQSGKYTRRQTTENYKEEPVEKERKRDAYARWHDEPSRIVWIIMMNAVDNEVNLLSQTALRFIMKYVPVNEVLEECPEQNAEQK